MNASRTVWSGVLLALSVAQAAAQTASQASDRLFQAWLQSLFRDHDLKRPCPRALLWLCVNNCKLAASATGKSLASEGNPAVTFNRQSNSINVRGVDRDRVVVRVDGIRIPWLDDGARGEQGGLSTIDFNTLSAIDLVGAAGAPQSGAITGYLDVRTLAPEDLLQEGQAIGFLARTGYDGADNSRYMDAALAGTLATDATKWLVQLGPA